MVRPEGNIYLIGPMGSGKTSIGSRVARILGMQFIDCDHELEEQTGASVSLIFDIEGEEGFRARESRLLEDLTSRSGLLVATGGGAILHKENREMMSRTGLVVYLETPVEQQLRRLSRDRSRPLLQTDDRRKKLERLAAERNPLYREIADIEFPARNRGLGAVAAELAREIENYGNSE